MPATNSTEVRKGLGLRPLGDPAQQYARADRVIVLAAQQFDFVAKRIPATVRYVGTPIDDAATTADWENLWSLSDTRPLVLVSLSTLRQGQGPVLSRIVDAVAELPIRALVTLGPSLRRDDFPSPEDVRFQDFVPHSAVMPHCTAIVSQCGLGTLSKALMNDLPVVCIPLVGDQPDNAARIVAKGAGVRLSPQAPVEAIRSAISQVVTDDRYRAGARNLGELLRARNGAEEAANEIESMA